MGNNIATTTIKGTISRRPAYSKCPICFNEGFIPCMKCRKVFYCSTEHKNNLAALFSFPYPSSHFHCPTWI